jgi:SAM-dependent methyltransferase
MAQGIAVASARACPVCEGESAPLDVVDFNKCCEEIRGKHLPLSGIPIYYNLCDSCGFCFAPEFCDWTLEDFEREIYNQEYESIDPDYIEARPRENAKSVVAMLDSAPSQIRHLDYGGGNGLLSDTLFQKGWDSTSYDPFVNRDVAQTDLGTFDLITAFEVFEHVPNVNRLVSDLAALLRPEGIVAFSTLVSDGNLARGQRLTWWYASPRNGHISLFSHNSLIILAAKRGLKFGSMSPGRHVFWRNVPLWARAFISD